jgi:phosphatidylglycerophosphatase A
MSPVAPGTAGSLATVLLLAAVYWGVRPSLVAWNLLLVGGIVLFGGLCVALGRWTIQYYGRKDPGSCVLDEAAGICLTALLVPIYPPGTRAAWVLFTVFAAFRVFDVVKLPPARQLERLPLGWGILVDDLAAAVYANVACQLVVRWLIV